MKQSHLGKFLNRMGHTRAKYGGVMVKKVEVDGDLELHVVPWRDLITDQIDITILSYSEMSERKSALQSA